MSYIEESLSDGEEIVDVFKFHWTKWALVWLWVLLGVPTAGIGFFIALYLFLKYRGTEHGLTNKRVIFKTGIISRNTDEMKLDSIETVEIEQGVWGRILGFGTVEITGRGVSGLQFVSIDDPLAVKKKIESVGASAD